MQYINKKQLYSFVDNIKELMGIKDSDYPLDVQQIISKKNMLVNAIVETIPFKTKGLCGAAFVGEKHDTILLNSCRDKRQQNFDCAHELMHLTKHRHLGIITFNCFEKTKACQNKALEWQANEGSAEFILPYRLLLPLVKENYNHITADWSNTCAFKEKLSLQFNAPFMSVEYRLESLKYEIYQYINGTSLNNLNILSNNAQTKQGIIVESINDIEDNSFMKVTEEWLNAQ